MRQSNLLYPILIIAVLFFINWYVFQGVQTLTQDIFPWSQIIHLMYWIFFGSLTAALLYSLRSRSSGKLSLFSRITFHAFLTVIVTQLVFLLVLFAEDVYRGVLAITYILKDVPVGESMFPERSIFISKVGMMLAGIPLVSFVYGIARGKYDYKVHRHTLYYDNLPDAFDGFTITQISDVHAGSLKNPVAVQKGIDLIRAQNSDIFVFTGDLVNNLATEIEPWLEHFKQIHASYGKFAVLGNHDYGDYVGWDSWEQKAHNLKQLKKHHESLGHRLLLNENVTIEKEGQHIALVGVENWGQGFCKKGDLEGALSGVDPDAFKILLSHDPTHWDAHVKNHPAEIHLTLSGHTHGMQVGIEMPGLRWSPVKYRYPNWAGLARHGKKYLNVNRGFGFIGFEGRIGIWPEITVIELRKSR